MQHAVDRNYIVMILGREILPLSTIATSNQVNLREIPRKLLVRFPLKHVLSIFFQRKLLNYITTVTKALEYERGCGNSEEIYMRNLLRNFNFMVIRLNNMVQCQ